MKQFFSALRTTALLSVLLLSLALCACQSDSTSITGNPDTLPDRVSPCTLRVLTSEMEKALPVLQTFADHFEEKYPGCTVELVSSTAKLSDMEAAIAEQEVPPDILLFADASAEQLAESGLLRDLSDSAGITAALENERLFPGLRRLCISKDGMLFGVPCGMSVFGYALNTELFEQHGLSLPAVDWTIADFEALAADAYYDENGDGLPEVSIQANMEFDPLNWDVKSWNEDYPYGACARNGGLPPLAYGLCAATDFQPAYDTDAFRTILQDYLNLYVEFPFYPAADSAKIQSKQYSLSVLLWPISTYQYTPAYTRNGQFLNPIVTEAPVVAYPSVNGLSNLLFLYWYGISARSTQSEMAELFLTEWLDEGWQRENSTEMPLFTDFSRYSQLPYPESYEALYAAGITQHCRFYYSGELGAIWDEQTYKLFSFEQTAAECAEELQKRVTRLLETQG